MEAGISITPILMIALTLLAVFGIGSVLLWIWIFMIA